MRRTGFIALSVALAAAVLVSAGCSKNSAEKKGKEALERHMGKALSQGGAGETKVDLGSKGAIDLSGLPGDLRCPDTVPMAHISGGGQGDRGDTYIFQAEGSVAEVAAFYKNSLSGWNQSIAMETEDVVSMAFDSPDGARQVSVLVGSEQNTGKTNLSLTLTGK
jgi:hypothetical protein